MNRELLQQAIGLVPLGFRLHTRCTRLAIFLDKFTESRPGVVSSNEVYCLVLTRVSGKDMIVLMSENAESEIIRVWNVDKVVVSEKTIGGN